MSHVLSKAPIRRRNRALAIRPLTFQPAGIASVPRAGAIGLVVPAGLLAAWHLAAAQGWLPYQILPPPAQVWATLREAAASGDLLANTLISLRRVLEGFAIGAGCGVVIGVGLGLSRHIHALFDPILICFAQIPPLGWIPLLILFLGVDESLKVTVIAYASAIPVLLNVAQGVRGVPTPYRELGQTLTFDPWMTLTRIILPAAVPAIFTGLREGLANAWQTMVAAEIFASTEGLGYAVGLGRQLFQIDLVLAMVMVLGVVGLTLNGGFRLLETRLLQWQARGP